MNRSEKMREDVGKLVGMSVWLALEDLEQACTTLGDLGFEGMSVVYTQVGSRLISAPVYEGHYAAAGDIIREAGLVVSTLNAIEDAPRFDPFSSTESNVRSAEGLARHLRNASAMGAPGILIWDGRADGPGQLEAAPRMFTECIARARELAGPGTANISISVEFHPFTFALKYGKLPELAAMLPDVGAGFCIDFCHFGVALGKDFIKELTDPVMEATREVHYSDTDCKTSEFHYPAGRGILDMEALEEHFRGRQLPVGLDLFQWPAPRSGARSAWDKFTSFVRAQEQS
jgi:sugar phosphate isomerase/epimerase